MNVVDINNHDQFYDPTKPGGYVFKIINGDKEMIVRFVANNEGLDGCDECCLANRKRIMKELGVPSCNNTPLLCFSGHFESVTDIMENL